jgi:hypothetical protein
MPSHSLERGSSAEPFLVLGRYLLVLEILVVQTTSESVLLTTEAVSESQHPLSNHPPARGLLLNIPDRYFRTKPASSGMPTCLPATSQALPAGPPPLPSSP